MIKLGLLSFGLLGGWTFFVAPEKPSRNFNWTEKESNWIGTFSVLPMAELFYLISSK